MINFTENDALVIVARNGEELHIPAIELEFLLNAAAFGVSMDEESSVEEISSAEWAIEWMAERGHVSPEDGAHVITHRLSPDPDPYDVDNDVRADR